MGKPNKNLDAYKEITGGYVPVATSKDATGMQGVGITGTQRDIAKEMEAAKLGYSSQYIASRGGLNSQGYFNDVALSGQLTSAEQNAVTLPNGTVNTQAMADILQKKQIDELVSKGVSLADATSQVSTQYGQLGVPLVTGGYDASGKKVDNGKYNADGTLASTSGTKDNLNQEITKETRDAYALLSQTFRSYGLETLVPAIEGFMKRNLGPNEATIELRATPEYIARFKGNETRRDSGKNALTEAEYLAVEDAYDQTLRAYGQQDYFGINRKTKQEKTAELIGNDISAVEFRDRIQLAVDRVQNADPMTKSVLKQFYPDLKDADLIGYFLNPEDNLPKLKEKVAASEIGAAAVGAGAGLTANLASASDLARYGVDQEMAREGYSKIAGILPTASKLGNIYNETGVKYAQAEGEAEVFKSNQDAATKRKRLASMERAAFSGSSGTDQGSLARSTQGLL
jgi:hypothetical protein